MSWLGLVGFAWSDYDREVGAGDAAFAAATSPASSRRLPAYGGSLVLRAPFAGITALLGGGETAVWRALAIPCLLVVAWLAVVLVRRMRDDGRSTGVCAPRRSPSSSSTRSRSARWTSAIPRSCSAARCAIAAVLAAGRSRAVLAAVLLGLAIATKAWAVLAIGPVLLALPQRRILALFVAGAVAAVVLAPLALFGTHAAIAARASTGS